MVTSLQYVYRLTQSHGYNEQINIDGPAEFIMAKFDFIFKKTVGKILMKFTP